MEWLPQCQRQWELSILPGNQLTGQVLAALHMVYREGWGWVMDFNFFFKVFIYFLQRRMGKERVLETSV